MDFAHFRFKDRNFSSDKFHHIYSRGFSKMKIFRENDDCFRFIQTMLFYAKLYKVKLFSYALMDNHFHLLAQGEEIGNFMSRFLTSYASYFNTKYKRRGHVFDGRYNSIAVTKEEYFRELQKYIAMNPVKYMKNMPNGGEIGSSVQELV